MKGLYHAAKGKRKLRVIDRNGGIPADKQKDCMCQGKSS
jgi:hypothetical protein